MPDVSPGLMTRFGQHLDSRKSVYAQAIGSISFLAVPDVGKSVLDLSPSWGVAAVAFIVLAVAANIYGIVSMNERTAQVERLEAESEALRRALSEFDQDYRETCSRRLLTIGEQADFRGSDRISLYKFDGDKFVMLGRSAEIPRLKAMGRGVYPPDQGVIGLAWLSTEGKYFIDNLPDPNTDLESYKQTNEREYNFPRDLVDNIPMKSRTIAAYVLKDVTLSTRSAILVFESLEPHRFTDEELSSIVRGQAGRDLLLLMDAMKTREPSLDLARRKGF